MLTITDLEEKLATIEDTEREYATQLRFADAFLPDAIFSNKTADEIISDAEQGQYAVDHQLMNDLYQFIVKLDNRVNVEDEFQNNDAAYHLATDILDFYCSKFALIYNSSNDFGVLYYYSCDRDALKEYIPCLRFKRSLSVFYLKLPTTTLANIGKVLKDANRAVNSIFVPAMREMVNKIHQFIQTVDSDNSLTKARLATWMANPDLPKNYGDLIKWTLKCIAAAQLNSERLQLRANIDRIKSQIARLQDLQSNHAQKTNIEDIAELNLSKFEDWFQDGVTLKYPELDLKLYWEKDGEKIPAAVLDSYKAPLFDFQPQDIVAYFENQGIPLDKLTQTDIDLIDKFDYETFLSDYYKDEVTKKLQDEFSKAKLYTKDVNFRWLPDTEDIRQEYEALQDEDFE